MPFSQPQFSSLDDVAHIIQVALTPVFLLSSIGTLINVFSARLGRVSDQVDKIMEAAAVAGHRDKVLADRRLRQLNHRSRVLDIAVILASFGGASTCGAALTLFYGALRNSGVASALYGLFGLAILFTIASLAAFVYEMLLAGRFLRARVDKSGSDARG